MGADSTRLSVQGWRKHGNGINLPSALCKAKAEFAEIPKGYFGGSECLQCSSHEDSHPSAGGRGEFAIELHMMK